MSNGFVGRALASVCHRLQSPVPRRSACRATPASRGEDAEVPWSISNYYTKKRERRTDSLGRIIQTPETIAEPIGWTPDAKLQLAIQVVSKELQQPEAELLANVQRLQALLPDVDWVRSTAGLVRLAASVERVAQNLIVLREALPDANVSLIVAGNLRLCTQQPAALRAEVCQAKELLGGHPGRDAVFEAHPVLLDSAALSAVLQELGRLFDGAREPPAALLCRNPGLATLAGSLRQQSRGERDEAYLSKLVDAAAMGKGTMLRFGVVGSWMTAAASS